MSTLFDDGEVSPPPGTEPTTPNPNPNSAPPLRRENLHQHPVVREIYLNDQGVPAAFEFDPDAPLVPTMIDEQGIVWAGETIVAHLSPQNHLRHAMEFPPEPTPEVVARITRALIANQTYLHNDFPTIARVTNGVHSLHSINNTAAFDTHLAACMAFVRIKASKDDLAFIITQLDARSAAAIHASAAMRESLPPISTVNQIPLPYFPADGGPPRYNPVGYNRETRTYTLGTARAMTRQTTTAALKRWHRRRVHEFKWASPSDYVAYVAQSLTPFVAGLLRETMPDGTPGPRPITPASLIEASAASSEGSSGKSTLQLLAGVAAYGEVKEKHIPDRAELYAQIVTTIRARQPYIFIDEAKYSMGDELLTVISGEGEGRIKGFSEEVRGDLHVMIAAVAPKFSAMMARRVLACQVDTVPREIRKVTRFLGRENILKYRSIMISFLTALVQTWVDKGCPLAKPFHEWHTYSRIVGGILEANDYPNVLAEKCAASSAREDNEHMDAQWPAYFRLLADGTLNLYSGDDNTPIKVEGSHSARYLLQSAQLADFYPELNPNHSSAPRTFLKSLAPWLDTDKTLCGYTFHKERKNTGTCVRIVKKSVDTPPAECYKETPATEPQPEQQQEQP